LTIPKTDIEANIETKRAIGKAEIQHPNLKLQNPKLDAVGTIGSLGSFIWPILFPIAPRLEPMYDNRSQGGYRQHLAPKPLRHADLYYLKLIEIINKHSALRRLAVRIRARGRRLPRSEIILD